jgi:hypothetical protein
MMNGPEKSDFLVVAKKPANKPETSGAEWAEPRGKAKGNTGEKRTRRTLGRESVFQRLDRVRLAARQKGPSCASPPNTRGKSPVRESRPPGSVRGVSGNGHSYRDYPCKRWPRRRRHASAGESSLIAWSWSGLASRIRLRSSRVVAVE